MDKVVPANLLPPVYTAALLLSVAGFDDDRIALELDLPAEAVSTLLELGRRKLARLVNREVTPGSPHG